MKKFKLIFNDYYYVIITVIFLVLSLIIINKHEFWRDETRAWLISSGVHSFGEFYSHFKIYGHPFLWNLVLFLSGKIVGNMEVMKFVHVAISTVSAFLILKFAPFNKPVKAMIVFGYFMFYEYSIISRDYAIGLLFIILFCVLYKDRYKKIIPLAIILFFMGQSNVFSLVLSIVFVAALTWDLLLKQALKKSAGYPLKTEKLKLVYFYLIIISGFLLLLFQFRYAISEGTPFSQGFDLKDSVKCISNGIIIGILPVVENELRFWNTNIILSYLSNFRFLYTFIFSVILLAIPLFLIKKKFLFLYIAGAAGILAIPMFVYESKSIRHFGHLFILLIICFWLSVENKQDGDYIIRNGKIAGYLYRTFFILILLLSFYSSVVATVYDYKYPFSESREVAEFLKKNYKLEDIKIAGYFDHVVEPVSAYLDREIYHPREDRFSVISDHAKIKDELTVQEIFKKLEKIIAPNEKFIFILSKEQISEEDLNSLKPAFTENKKFSFENAIVLSENFYVYEFIRIGK
jgi:hypothetical protein